MVLSKFYLGTRSTNRVIHHFFGSGSPPRYMCLEMIQSVLMVDRGSRVVGADLDNLGMLCNLGQQVTQARTQGVSETAIAMWSLRAVYLVPK
jgi:hypothetical protein